MVLNSDNFSVVDLGGTEHESFLGNAGAAHKGLGCFFIKTPYLALCLLQ